MSNIYVFSLLFRQSGLEKLFKIAYPYIDRKCRVLKDERGSTSIYKRPKICEKFALFWNQYYIKHFTFKIQIRVKFSY